MINYSPQPPTDEEVRLSMLPVQSLVSRPLALLSMEERALWMITLEHRNRVDGLHAALTDHQANFRQAMDGDDAQTQDANCEWATVDEELRYEIIAEDQCFHLPIGHEFGEIENDRRDLDHWEEAPGVVA